MIHRYQVDPPQTTVLIKSSPEREQGGYADRDFYVNARMTGGRNDLGEWIGPCLILVDDETPRGKQELAAIEERLAEGRLPGVRPYEPGGVGIGDDEIEALVQRRVAEELARRGLGEQPSEEARADLGLDEEPESYRDIAPAFEGRQPMRVEIVQEPGEPIIIARSPDGRLRCPLDRRLFKEGQSWTVHWTRNLDPKHIEIAQAMVEAV